MKHLKVLLVSLFSLLTIGCSPKYTYCHYEDTGLFSSLFNGPIHLRTTEYEEIVKDNVTYYKFTFKYRNFESVTLNADDCTLYYSRYCPVCQKVTGINWE